MKAVADIFTGASPLRIEPILSAFFLFARIDIARKRSCARWQPSRGTIQSSLTQSPLTPCTYASARHNATMTNGRCRHAPC